LYTLKDSSNPKALTVKGDALYNLGNFEHALLNYHRAMRSSSTKVAWKVQYSDHLGWYV
jgi:predicted negative regulator of RcsB-dependent stress response